MAIYSCSISNSRKNGVKNISAKEHHEYISRIGNYSPTVEREKFQSATSHLEYIQRQESYQHREEYEDLVCSDNKNMPSWAVDNPNLFWIASEEFERVNGRTYSEFLLSLPCELGDDENEELVKKFCKEMFGESFVHSYGIHSKESQIEGIQNIHAHIMFSERKLDGIERSDEKFFKRYNPNYPERGGAKKDRFWNDQKMFRYTRKTWENILNKELEKKGLEKVSASSLDIQRMEAKLAGDVLKEEFLNRPPINCPGKILMKLEKHGIDTLSKKEKEQYESYLFAKELRDMAKEVYTLSRELEKEEATISSPFVVETKKEEILLETPKIRKEKIKEFTKQFTTVIEDRVRYAVFTEKQEEEANRRMNSYEEEKWRSKYLGAGLGTLLLEEPGNIYQRQLKEILLERTKSSKISSTIKEVPFFQKDYTSLKHEDFEFIPSPELYQAQRKKVERELKEITLEKEKKLQEHQEWHFKNYLSTYISVIDSSLLENNNLEDSKKRMLVSYQNKMKQIEKKMESLESKREQGTFSRFFSIFEEKSLEREIKDCYQHFSDTLKEYQKDSEIYKTYTSTLLQYANISQEVRRDFEKNEIGKKFVEDIQALNVKKEIKELEIEYLSYLESHGILNEKIVKNEIEEKVKIEVASFEKEQEKILQEKEAMEQKKQEEIERKKIEEKAEAEAKSKLKEEELKRFIKKWTPKKQEFPTIPLIRDINKFDHKLLDKYLEVASGYSESLYRLESAEKALQHPEKFKNQPQIVEKYKKLRKEHLSDRLTYGKSLDELKKAINNEMCYYLSGDLTPIYRKKYEDLLKEQRRVSSILDQKKEKGENATQEFAKLKGIQNQKFYLERAFVQAVKVLDIQAEFTHLFSKKEKTSSGVAKIEKRTEKEKDVTVASSVKRVPSSIQKGKEDSSNSGMTRTENKKQETTNVKRVQKQEEASKVKGNYLAPVIPKKKKKKWKDLFEDDREF